MDPPVVIQLKMPRKVLPAHLALPRPLDAMHGALVDRKRIVVVDDDLAHWAADRRFGFCFVLLLLFCQDLVHAWICHVVEPLVLEEKCLGSSTY